MTLRSGDRLKITIELPARRIVGLELDGVEELLEPVPAHYYSMLVSQFGWQTLELVAVNTSGQSVQFDVSTLIDLGHQTVSMAAPGELDQVAGRPPMTPAFPEAMTSLTAHLVGCSTCGPVFDHLNGRGMLCKIGRDLANAVDRAAGKEPSF